MNNTIKTYDYNFSSFVPVDGRHHLLKNFQGDGVIFKGKGNKTSLIQAFVLLFRDRLSISGMVLL